MCTYGSYFCSAALDTSEFRNIFWFFDIKAVTVYFLSVLNSCFFEMLMILELNSANISALITRVILCHFIEDRWGLLWVYHKRKCFSPWLWCVVALYKCLLAVSLWETQWCLTSWSLQTSPCSPVPFRMFVGHPPDYYYKPTLTWSQCLVNFSAF